VVRVVLGDELAWKQRTAAVTAEVGRGQRGLLPPRKSPGEQGTVAFIAHPVAQWHSWPIP